MVEGRGDNALDDPTSFSPTARGNTRSRAHGHFRLKSERNSSTGSGRSMNEIKIPQDKDAQDFIVKPIIAQCSSVSKAR